MSLTSNLIAYYKLDEAGGANDALDAHSAGPYNLTQHGSPGGASGVLGTARDLNAAVPQYFERADDAAFSTGDIDFGFSGWIYLNATGSSREILGKWNPAGSDEEYRLNYNAFTLDWTVRNTANSGYGVVSSSVTLSATTWYHFDCWHDSVNDQLGICINAGTPDLASYSGGVRDGTAPFRLGMADFTAWHGRLDESGFWKRVLTSGERTTLYGAGTPPAFSTFGGGAVATPSLLLLGCG